MDIEEFGEEFVELFGTLISQELAEGSPVDTSTLQKSWMSTFEVVDGNTLQWTLPFYWEYVEFIPTFKSGKPNPNFAFTRRILENKVEEIAEKAIKILEKR